MVDSKSHCIPIVKSAIITRNYHTIMGRFAQLSGHLHYTASGHGAQSLSGTVAACGGRSVPWAADPSWGPKWRPCWEPQFNICL